MNQRTHLSTDVISHDWLILVATDLTNKHPEINKLHTDLHYSCISLQMHRYDYFPFLFNPFSHFGSQENFGGMINNSTVRYPELYSGIHLQGS